MITLNKLTKELHDEMLRRDEITSTTSPRAMSIRVSRDWRRMDACQTYEKEFSEREELAADIIIDTALAMRQLGCKNIEQAIKDRIAWRLLNSED